MMKHGPVAKVRRMGFRAVIPCVDGLVVLDGAAPFFHRRQGVVVRMCHRRSLKIHG